jgi:hypothetical protein
MSNIPITNCNFCGLPVIEIDHYGERLIGCVDCNRWSWEGSGGDRLFMELPSSPAWLLESPELRGLSFAERGAGCKRVVMKKAAFFQRHLCPLSAN